MEDFNIIMHNVEVCEVDTIRDCMFEMFSKLDCLDVFIMTDCKNEDDDRYRIDISFVSYREGLFDLINLTGNAIFQACSRELPMSAVEFELYEL